MKRNDLLKTIALIAVIIVVTVGSSIALNLYTGPKIEENKLAAASGALAAVLPEGKAFEDITATLTIDPTSGVTEVHKETNGAGYVFMATAQGFSKPVNVTVGVSADGKIAGIDVVIGEGDFTVDNMIPTFVGQDSTLSGVVMQSGATVSSTAVKTAVSNGLIVLATNNLMKAAEKSAEQVFEELLPTVYNGFVKDNEVAGSGNITVAYKAKNGSGLVAFVTKGEQTLLALCNNSLVVAVYQTKLIDETTQTYELEEVTSANEDVVTEVSTFAKTNIVSSYSKLEDKIAKMYENAANITEIAVNAFGTVVAAASFEVEDVTYFAYYSKPINGFEGDVMDIYVVLDSEGKIAKTDVQTYFYGEIHYFDVANKFVEKDYESALGNGTLNNESYDGSQSLITGATYTTNAIDAAVKDVFKAFASQGGNE